MALGNLTTTLAWRKGAKQAANRAMGADADRLCGFPAATSSCSFHADRLYLSSAGSSAMDAREIGQVRKEAAISGMFHVPESAWLLFF
ncbi:hypothetical protein SD70_25230 [Gordoniibacillus kamchatkensis]|uniref:Uncharacterized protein n=1 Tax=Gordoniibacillus kamchatkensis TaxID=1590651 RepID=A0ABR5ACH0_9BACL|nr:hypothetical protein SD70_25230 [Paenibacillus sp. VKM B-2647]